MTPSPQPRSPYPGLRPFSLDESTIFFGRAAQLRDMVLKLVTSRFLAVVGASGAGKSSLVRAGLLPSLNDGIIKGLSKWRFVTTQPGGAPIAHLAQALASTSDPNLRHSARVEAALRRDSQGLRRAIESNSDPGQSTLILVDQFEEIFRYRQTIADKIGRDEAVAFVNMLLDTVRQRDVSAFVVITMRSDFLGDCNAFFGLPEAICESQFLTPRLTPEQLREAVERPLALKSFKAKPPEPEFVSRVINDMSDDPDQLPLMQHCLMRCWDIAKERPGVKTLTVEDYEQVGRMDQALSKHADEAYATFDNDRKRRRIAQHLFRSLCEPDREHRFVRRPVKIGEIAEICECSEADVASVAEEFLREPRHFLVKKSAEGILDITHEALIRQWKRLGLWLKAEAESVRTYQRLVDYTQSWKAGEAVTLIPSQRDAILTWRDAEHPNATWAARYHQNDDVKFEDTMAFLELSSRHVVHRELLMNFIEVEDPIWCLALSRDSKTLASVGEKSIIRLWNAQQICGKPLATLSALPGLVHALAFAPSGTFLVCAGEDETVKLWDCQDLQKPIPRDPLSVQNVVWTLALSPDGQFLATAGDDGLIRLWDVRSPEMRLVATFGGDTGHAGAIWSVAFHPKRPILASASADQTVRIWNLSTLEPEPLLHWKAHDGYVWKVVFHPLKGKLASAGADNLIHIWDLDVAEESNRRKQVQSGLRTPKPLHTLAAHKNAVTSLDFSPDGRTLASGSVDQKVLLWSVDPFRKDPVTEFTGHEGTVRSVAFWPDGHALVSAGADGAIMMWNTKSKT